MNLFGKLKELNQLLFRVGGKVVTVAPASQTGDPTITIPDTGSSASREIVLKDLAQTLTNKTIDGDDNTVQDLALTSLKTNVTDASKFLNRDGSGIVVSSAKAIPSGVVVGDTDTITLTNKKRSDSTTTIVDSVDATKIIQFDAAGTTGTSTTITSAQTVNRVLTLPDATDTLTGKATADVFTNKTYDAAGTGNVLSNVANSHISASAAIAYSKLNLAASIVNADIATGAALAYSKLSLNDSIVNADINTAAAIAYSKLNLTTSIVNADIATAAAIARSKLAVGSTNHVIINNGSGVLSSEAQLSISRGGTGQSTANPAFNALSPLTTKGDLVGFSTVNARVAVGADGTVLTADSAQATGLTWTSPLTNPMTTQGDIIHGGVAGSATRLALGTANQVLAVNAGATDVAYTLVNNANVGSSAAIAGTKIAPDFGSQTVLTTGSVGINKASPGAKLDVVVGGTGHTAGDALRVTSNADTATATFSAEHATYTGSIISAYSKRGSSTGYNLFNAIIGDGSSYNITEVFKIRGDGRLIAGVTTSTFPGHSIYGVQSAISNDATAGTLGEYSDSNVTTATNTTGNGVTGDAATITLTAGDWDVSGFFMFIGNGSTFAGGFEIDTWIAAAAGNSTTGFLPGVNGSIYQPGTTAVPSNIGIALPTVRVRSNGTDLLTLGTTTAGTQVIRLKMQPSGLSAGTPQYKAHIHARRVR